LRSENRARAKALAATMDEFAAEVMRRTAQRWRACSQPLLGVRRIPRRHVSCFGIER
jgi:hypothetical protein